MPGGTATGEHNQLSRFTVNDADPQQPGLRQRDADPRPEQPQRRHQPQRRRDPLRHRRDALRRRRGQRATFTANSAVARQRSSARCLRINVVGFTPAIRDDAAVGHLIPADNPFVGTASGVNQLIYALGLRNPFTFAVQPGTGRIFINDVGQEHLGGNRRRRRRSQLRLAQQRRLPPAGDTATTIGAYRDPLLAYNHTGGPAGGGQAIVGGIFYNPATPQFPSSFVGKYFYEDLTAAWIRVFDPAQPGSLANPDTSISFATGDAGTTVDLKVDAAGNLYYLSRGGRGGSRRSRFRGQSPTGASPSTLAARERRFVRRRRGFQGGRAAAPGTRSTPAAVVNPGATVRLPVLAFGEFQLRDHRSHAGGSVCGTPRLRGESGDAPVTAPFNVTINGAAALSNFNVFSAAGGRFKAVEKDFTATADADGKIILAFKGVTGPAEVAGIAVSPA